jgi:hypothetical protein
LALGTDGEAKEIGKREEHRFAETAALLAVDLRRAQDGAVGRYEREEDSERGVKRRKKPFHRDVDELHERRDHENERESVDVAETVRREKPVVDTPRNGRSDRHHENDRARHAEGGIHLLGDAKERTAPEKAVQNEIVHKNRADKQH